jgi:hypothetical protein
MDGNAWNRIQQTLPSLMNPLAMLLTATDSDTKELCSLGVATCTTQFLPAHQSVPITFILTGVKSGKVHCKVGRTSQSALQLGVCVRSWGEETRRNFGRCETFIIMRTGLLLPLHVRLY